MVTYGDEEYLTPQEASKLLGVTRRTLDRYAEEKRIAKYRKGFHNIVFKRSDVERLKQELEEIKPVDD